MRQGRDTLTSHGLDRPWHRCGCTGREDHRAPLHLASRFGYPDLAGLLINCGANVNTQEEDRWTPLHCAPRYGYFDLARLLINCGPDVNTQAEDRWIALHLTSSDGHLEIAKLLIDYGANVDDSLGPGFALWYLEVVRFLIERRCTAVSAPG